MFGGNVNLINSQGLYYLISYLPVLIVLSVASTPVIKKIKINKYVSPVLIVLGFLLAVAYVVNSSYNPFLYFRF